VLVSFACFGFVHYKYDLVYFIIYMEKKVTKYIAYSRFHFIPLYLLNLWSSSADSFPSYQQSSRFDELPDDFDPSGKLPGSFDDGDPQTTNLYVGNLSPQVCGSPQWMRFVVLWELRPVVSSCHLYNFRLTKIFFCALLEDLDLLLVWR
jgi:hypothetical protein